jgi:hypothetical protein
MKNTTCDPGEIWKQFEDLLVPRLGLSVVDRAAYSHLLRHSRLEGKVRLRFSILWLALGIGLATSTARDAVRRLVNLGALRLLARTKGGHVVEVRLPWEIRGLRAHEKWAGLPAAADELTRLPGDSGHASPNLHPNIDHDIEKLDFMQSFALRKAIHERESGVCFYCLRRLTPAMQGLDHVVPRAQSGSSSYRNLVSCCLECNSRKGETPAADFLRWLYREGRLTPAELTDRLRALEALAAGELLPALVEAGFSLPRATKGPASFPLESHASPVPAGGIYPDPLGSPSSFPLESHADHSCSAGFTPAVSCSGRAEFIPTRSGDRCSSPRERPLPQSCSDPASARPPLLPASADSASLSTPTLAEMERMTILRVFEQARGDKALAGKMLGISRATLYRKLKRYNIPIKGVPDDVAAEPQPPS